MEWIFCRVIGFLNMIFFGLSIITTLVTLSNWIFSLLHSTRREGEYYHSYSYIEMILFIILLVIVVIFMIVFFIINYEMTPASPPGGDKIMRWLLFHKVLFCAYIISIIYMAIIGHGYIYGGFLLFIILAIEIFIVYKYNGETPGGLVGIDL